MTLTAAQLTTLGNDIRANTDPDVVAALAAGNNNLIANWYNGDASPGYWIFRSEIPSSEVADAINLQNMVDITAADKDRVLALFELRSDRGFSGEIASDRSAWSDVFSAAAGDESQQAIAALWQRLATEAEKVFSLSTGSGADIANSDTTSFQGAVTSTDVDMALEATAP